MRTFRGFAPVMLAIVGTCVRPVHADIDPLSGIDFVTVGNPGNAPWTGNGTPADQAIGRGSVGYEFRIGKFEVTTAQWCDFMNAAFDRPQADWIPHVALPGFWGATPTSPNTPGGRRWTVPAGNQMIGVGNISWRMAAIYCNWLHHGMSTDREAFLNGAYDVSTFTSNPGGRFYDQLTRSPGARYFIPTWDEWLKSAHYDPNKQNQDGSTGGWWHYSNGTDQPFIAGPPGVGTANYGWDSSQYPGQSPFTLPLGSYGVTSPYGLLDVAGFTKEWTEEAHFFPGEPLPIVRELDGTSWLEFAGDFRGDSISYITSSEHPSVGVYDFGFRIASIVPAPTVWVPVAGFYLVSVTRRRRSHAKNDKYDSGFGIDRRVHLTRAR